MTKGVVFNNVSDTIDSRDVIERIEELESDLTGICPKCDEDIEVDAIMGIDGNPVCSNCKESLDVDSDIWEEYKALKDLEEQGENYAPDWEYGEVLIHEDYFTEYCEQLCEDIGSIPSDLPAYIANNINWEGVADDLRQDYTTISFDGQDYLIR